MELFPSIQKINIDELPQTKDLPPPNVSKCVLVDAGNKQTAKLCETTFIAGNISKYIDEWKKLTNDESVLQMVKGCYLEIDLAFAQVSEPRELPFSEEESEFIDNEIKKLLEKGVIEESWDQKDQFISNIFLRPKKDGSFRMILNMKELNESLEYHHFKMDSIQTCVHLMSPGSYMASFDLQDAYYSVPILEKHRKYLKFRCLSLHLFAKWVIFCTKVFYETFKTSTVTLESSGIYFILLP